ncbi:MAG: hypothetical protein Kow0068_00240 [Marinilabiliales bacterium]
MKAIQKILIILYCLPVVLDAQSSEFFMQAKAKLDYNQLDSALFYINKAINEEPSVKYFMFRGKLFFDLKRYDEALSDFNFIESKEPGMASFYIAKIYALQKKTDMAVNWLLIHLNSKYKKPKSIIRTDEAFNSIRNEKKYQDIWLKDWYSDYEIAIESVIYYINNDELVHAIEEFDNIFQNYSPTGELYFERALVYIKLEDYKNALKDLENAIKLNSENYEYHNTRAKVYLEMKRYKKALKEYNVAINLNNTNPTDYYNRGVAYYKLQMFNEALEDFTYYLKFYDKDETAYYYAGQIYNITGDYNKALIYLNKLLSLNKGIADYYIERIKAYEGLENYTQMLIDCNNALDLDPKNGLIFYKRGIAKLNMKDTDGACKDWANAIRNGYFDANEYIHSYCK